MKGQKRIEVMYAFVLLDPRDNTEGVPAFSDPSPGGMVHPMVGADMARVEDLKPMAKKLATMAGARITLCKFSVRQELETFDPE